MSSNQKRGFRLPWGTERPEGGDETVDPPMLDAVDPHHGAGSDAHGETGHEPVEAAHDMTTDAVPAASDKQDSTSEAAMFDAEAPTSESAAPPPDDARAEDSAWPSTDKRASDEGASDRRQGDRRVADRRGLDRPLMGGGEPRVPRRDNPLVAGLVKAMREAAIASRSETTARLAAEATARVEAIRARATTEAAGLRKRADEDVSTFRDWSKAEMARVRQQTEDRIDARKAELAGEIERHAGSVDRLVAEVETTVAAFEADMDRFFTDLLAEDDPGALAQLAEQAPDPPDLRGEGPAATDLMDEPEGLHAAAAAEAEAEAGEGLGEYGIEQWPSAVLAAASRVEVSADADANGPDSTRLLVSGLTSVAGISAFKGALQGLEGVRSVSVSSGEKGVFIFAVSHDPGVDLDSGIASLAGFAAHITDATNDGFVVDAHEPAA